MEQSWDEHTAYQARLEPLLEQVHEICRELRLPYFMSVIYGVDEEGESKAQHGSGMPIGRESEVIEMLRTTWEDAIQGMTSTYQGTQLEGGVEVGEGELCPCGCEDFDEKAFYASELEPLATKLHQMCMDKNLPVHIVLGFTHEDGTAYGSELAHVPKSRPVEMVVKSIQGSRGHEDQRKRKIANYLSDLLTQMANKNAPKAEEN